MGWETFEMNVCVREMELQVDSTAEEIVLAQRISIKWNGWCFFFLSRASM